jgi:hypothetical protein
MKISELKTTRTVVRKSKKIVGRITYEKKSFETPYNPNIEILYQRLFAKFIDMGIVIGFMIMLNKFDFLNTNKGLIFRL